MYKFFMNISIYLNLFFLLHEKIAFTSMVIKIVIFDNGTLIFNNDIIF